MYRYIKAMGVRRNSRDIPHHYAYYPSIKFPDFKAQIDLASRNNDTVTIDGLIQIVINDIRADNTTTVPNQNIRAFYRKYYDYVSNNNLASPALLQQLQNLV